MSISNLRIDLRDARRYLVEAKTALTGLENELDHLEGVIDIYLFISENRI